MKLDFIIRDKIKASPMERVLENKLKQLKLQYYREVEFTDCINPKTKQRLRFDFYIPKLNTLIEYDGINWHKDIDVKYRDEVKNNWAINKGLSLYRITGQKQIIWLVENLKLILPIQQIKQTSTKSNKKKTKTKKSKSTQEGLDNLKALNKLAKDQLDKSRERSKNFIPQPLKRMVRP